MLLTGTVKNVQNSSGPAQKWKKIFNFYPFFYEESKYLQKLKKDAT